MKIAFFVKEGLDSFLTEIIEALSIEHEIEKVTVKPNRIPELVGKWMGWADACWFEWCDDLVIYASRLPAAKERKIICRLHSYEAFTNYPSMVDWNNVDSLIFVAEHLRKYVTERCRIDWEKTVVIPCGVDIARYAFKERCPGFNIAYAGYINYKKGPMLLLHAFKATHDRDGRYALHLAGRYQDPRYALYFQQMIGEFGLEKSVFFDGWQENLDAWLDDKDYILCSSLLESQNMSVMQAMAKGIKPVIHNFMGARGIYSGKYLWNTIDEAVGMVTETSYNSTEYREFIKDNYLLEKQLEKIKELLEKPVSKEKTPVKFSYKDYWTQRLNSNFNIQGVGYLGLGEIYNGFLYQNRMDILEGILNKAFDNICGIRVMELGPGTGIFTEYFHSRGVREYCAVDIVEKVVTELSGKYAGYRFRQGDISDSGLFEGKYDLIFAGDVLLHITDEDNYKKTIANISDHLEDNGFCILLDPISVTNSQSASPHVVIRDIEYVKGVLENNGLVVADMLPTANFMNYPFDRDIIGARGDAALQAFNAIAALFSSSAVPESEKQAVGEFLLYREKLLMCRLNPGLSEKMLILQKESAEKKNHIGIADLFDAGAIGDRLKAISQNIAQSDLPHPGLYNKISRLIDCLEEGEDNAQ